jgi:RNA polymerase sigma-70 factor (ECF subfamily)
VILALFGMAKAEADEDLVRRFKRGDQHAFSTLVTRYQDRVYSQCLRWMRDPRIAEEVSQDVFLAVYKALHRFRGEARFSTWIFRITVNHCKNRRLYRKRRHTDSQEPIDGPIRDEDGPVRQIPDDGPGTDRGVEQSEAVKMLYEALDALEESQRTIILLRDIQDLSYDEIAQILDLPKGTVKSRLHRARQELAKVVSRTYSESDVFD